MGKNDHEEERQKGWILILESYFRDLEKKAAFLRKLSDEGHEDEALTLCCCYIDGLSNGFYGREEGSNKNFIRALREFGENEIWGLIHPLQFVRNVLEIAQKNNQSKLKGIIEKIIPLLATLKDSLYGKRDPRNSKISAQPRGSCKVEKEPVERFFCEYRL